MPLVEEEAAEPDVIVLDSKTSGERSLILFRLSVIAEYLQRFPLAVVGPAAVMAPGPMLARVLP